MTWLIAEDDADIRNLITFLCQSWGHPTVAFEDGGKVWDWLDSIEPADAQSAPELVLMDIRMPGKRGNEVAQRMRSMPAFKHTPIVLMTAFVLSDGELAQLIDHSGVDRIISKPLPEFDTLRALLYDVRDKKAG